MRSGDDVVTPAGALTKSAEDLHPYIPTALQSHQVTENPSTNLVALFRPPIKCIQVAGGSMRFPAHSGSQQGVN